MAGVELLQSKRLVDVVYRGQVVPMVPVTCLANEVELRIRAAILQRAVACLQNPEMAAEKFLGFFFAFADLLLKICTDDVAQATLRQHSCLYDKSVVASVFKSCAAS